MIFLKFYNTSSHRSPICQKCNLVNWNTHSSASWVIPLHVFFKSNHTSHHWFYCLDLKEIVYFEIFSIVALPNLFYVLRIIVLNYSKANLYPNLIESIEVHRLVRVDVLCGCLVVVFTNLWLFRALILTLIQSNMSMDWELRFLLTQCSSKP